MSREFFKSGEFNQEKNRFASLEMLSRVPFFILIDILIIYRIASLF